MSFPIEPIAREYVYKRFPSASVTEKEKIIGDWKNKMKDSSALVEDFKRRVGDPSGKKILDVGCGNGGVGIAFALAGAYSAGVEIEEDLYLIAKKQVEGYKVNMDLHLYDGTRLPFDTNTFDYATSTSVLEHTSDPVLYLEETVRVLKKGGSLYLGFPNKLWPKETHTGIYFLTYLPSMFRSSLSKMLGRQSLEENNLHFYTYFDLQRMIKKINARYDITIVQEEGQSKSGLKNIIKKILGLFGLSYKAFLPHILVIVKKE